MRSLRRSAPGARLRPGTVALVVLLAMTSSACISRGGDGPGAPTGPSPALGQAPDALAAEDQAAALPEAGPVEASTTTAPRGRTTATVGGAGATTTSAPATPTTVASPTTTAWSGTSERGVVVSSQRDGADVVAPGYADLRALVVERTATRIRVTVEVGAAVPSHLADREVVGLGVDFSRPGAFESEAQLFVDGGVDGWRAYLQRGDGFVEYPGTFAIGGSRLVFEVPDSSLPHPLPSSISAFLDWSTKTPAPSNSADAMPDVGPLKPTP